MKLSKDQHRASGFSEIFQFASFGHENQSSRFLGCQNGYHEEMIENEYDVRSSDEEDLGLETTVTEE